VRPERGKELRDFGLGLVVISGVGMAALAVAIAYGKHPSSAWFVVGLTAFGLGLILYFAGLVGPRIPKTWWHPIAALKKSREPHEETEGEFRARGGHLTDENRMKTAEELMKFVGRHRIPPITQGKPAEPMKPTSLRCGLCGSLLSRRADGSLFCPKHST